ncbi:restriction endonuclease subunit S [Lacticaseibacillus paracasei]|uniref:restriction endonuclease subunit S n=1 Tax=Lacticaseibacillus paracasei TaxID=1597 RepID=UPI002989DD04|nr:restriction endonuclease subunit S [Lacticaseibacillus paracasei]
MRSDLFLKQLKSVLVAGAQPNVSSKEIDQFIFSVPATLNEQEKIGTFFEYLDSLIAATQHKIDALEQVKKALLQRLFDQSWRFDGYLETWKKYRLGDHAEILTGGTPKTSVAEYWEPKSIPWMSSGEVNKVYLDQTDTMISLEGFKNSSARWIKKHSILIALAGQGKTRGTVAVNNIALTTNQSIAAIIPGKDLYYEFVFQNLTNRYNELRLISSGDGTRGGLNKQIVSDVTIHSPNLNEQIRIGKLLSKVDHLSTENQLKLSRIELIKKYLLQTLFI